jgi:branched-chain amino acid transport system substrate-binding protein
MKLRFLLIFFLSSFILPVPAQKTEPVKIGLLIQDKISLAAKQGAELAIIEANEKGGANGREFQLITKDLEGPWGTGSRQAVDLIFENEVCALLGSHDGRNAHLVEQAATKSSVVFISAWSSDPSLSQAFVPWFFNCVPTDDQQADVLIKEICNKRKMTRIAVINDNTYDSDQSLKSFLRCLNKNGKNKPVLFNFDKYITELDILAEQINKAEVNGIVLFCRPSASLKIMRLMRQRKMNQPVFGSLSILNENKLSQQELQEFDNTLMVPSGTWTGSKNIAFRQEYQNLYGKMPGMVAAYAFDSMNLLIEATRTTGSTEREKIQNYLKNVTYEGVTGTFRFDGMGNRLEKRFLMQMKNGVPVAVGSN